MAGLGSVSLNMVWNPAISGSNFLQASMKGIHTYATKLDKVNILGSTNFPLLDRHIKQLDNHLGHIRSQTAKISANPIKLDIQTSATSLKEARKDMTAIEHDAKQVAFWTKKSSENLQNGTSVARKVSQKNNTQDISNSAIVGAVAVSSAIAIPVKASIEFESTVADITKVVDFSGAKEIKSFSNELLNLSNIIPLTVNQLGEISASGGQLGIAKNSILDFTTVVAKMSTAFDMSAGDAGTAMAGLMNIYGGGIKEVGILGDAINHLSNNSASKANDIVNVLGRIGGNAKALNMTAVQASNLASSFLALGKPPEIVGTALNSMLGKFGNIDGQSAKFKGSLSSMGIDAVAFSKKMRANPQEAMHDFLSTLNKMDKASQTKISYAMFGQEFGDDMLLLSSGVQHYSKAINLTAKETNYLGSMEREFQTRASTTANSLTLLKNKFAHFAIALGNTMLPIIKEATNYFGNLSSGLLSMTEKFPIASKWIFGLAGAFVVGSIALAGFGLIASGVGAGLAILTSPISLVVLGLVAIGTGAVLLYNKFEGVRNVIDGFFSGLIGGLSPVVEEFKTIFGGLFSSIGGLFNSLSPVFSAIGVVLNAVGISSTNLGTVMSGAFGLVLMPIKLVLGALTWMINLGSMVINGWVQIGTSAVSIWNKVTNAIKSPFITLFNWIEAKFRAVMGVVDKVKNIASTVTNVGSNVVNGAKDKASSLWSGTKSFFGFGDEKKEKTQLDKPTVLKNLPINNVGYKTKLTGSSSLQEIKNPILPLESVSGLTSNQLTQTKNQLQNNNNQKQVTQTITNQITVHASDGKIDYEDLKHKFKKVQKEVANDEQNLQFRDVS